MEIEITYIDGTHADITISQGEGESWANINVEYNAEGNIVAMDILDNEGEHPATWADNDAIEDAIRMEAANL